MDSTLDHLVDEVRSMIGDPAGSSQRFDREEVEDVIRSSGSYTAGWYLDTSDGYVYSLPLRWWAGVELYGPTGVALVPDVEDLIAGEWRFDTDPQSVEFYGTTYDLHKAAATLLERWAAWAASRKTDFSTPGLSVSRSQSPAQLLASAELHRKKQRAGSVEVQTL